MKFFLIVGLSLWAILGRAEMPLPPAAEILASARAQLPTRPIQMSGTLKERAENGFVKRTIGVKIQLELGKNPPRATYNLNNKKTKQSQTLQIEWTPKGPVFGYSEEGKKLDSFDPDADVFGLGMTWSDLSFLFLWSPDAKTIRTDRKLARDCYVLSVPRPEDKILWLWIEQTTGRLLGAEERDGAGKRTQIIKVVSVKEFDDIWMVKDLDIIRPGLGGKTSLRIDTVESQGGGEI